ncbi:hypothetical protein DEO72_LG10g2407 [Vigna unguiculata]|uniref:Uncharacterized protein n=1 Tax=Vigna unguiculata TaxID=3917 RepID=A0A4D6NEM0_VIGUN|nr:hypothetical protein DEO72_LG10g2407 [Vigna unguiculata]
MVEWFQAIWIWRTNQFECQNQQRVLLVWRLAARVCLSGDKTSVRDPFTVWRLAAGCDLPDDRPATVGLREAGAWWQRVTRQAITVKQGLCLWAWHLATGLVPLGGLRRFRLATLRLRQAIMLQTMACVCCF